MVFGNMLCIFACFHQILLPARIPRCAYAEPHQVDQLPGRLRAHANTILVDIKMLPEIMHQSLDFGPFSGYGLTGAVYGSRQHHEGLQNWAPRAMSLCTFDVFSQFSAHSCILKVCIRELVSTYNKILCIFENFTFLSNLWAHSNILDA